MIRVRCTDAIIRVGGDFQSQKDHIKTSGARWNGQQKLWESTRSVKDWSITPYDIEQGAETGDHITRYGTHYNRQEWTYLQESNRVKSQVSRTFQPDKEALRLELRNRLTVLGLTAEAVNRLWSLIDRGTLDVDLDTGRLKFSTPERAQQVATIEAWYEAAMGQLVLDELDAQQAAEERLADHLGCA